MRRIKIGDFHQKNLTLRKVARHEAGHAIVGLHFGLDILRITINKDYSGWCYVLDNMEKPLSNFAWALFGCAGSVAEKVRFINELDYLNYVKLYGYNEKNLLTLFDITEMILNKYENKIVELSNRLLDKKILFSSEIKRIYEN